MIGLTQIAQSPRANTSCASPDWFYSKYVLTCNGSTFAPAGGGSCICLCSLTNCGTPVLFCFSRSSSFALTMCEVRCEDLLSSTNSSTQLISNDDDSQWVDCGRKLRRNKNSILKEEEEFDQNNSSIFVDLPLELCDPMRRKITSLKPSLTPGAGTRIVRRRKPFKQNSMDEPACDSGEAFHQWREAMRSMARLPEGIPNQFRRKIWLILATHQIDSQHINWPRLVQTVFAPRSLAQGASEAEERLGRQIEKDLHRTGFCSFFGQSKADRDALKRVLTAYARWNRRVGYCQGFNILASVILTVMDRDEEDALKVMICLVDYILPESYFARNLQALSVDVTVFWDLLTFCQPNLAAHLQKLQKEAAIESMNYGSDADTSRKPKSEFGPPLTDLYAIQWFITLFSTTLPMSTVLRIWDAVFLEGSEVGLRAGLVVMEILSEDLMQLTSVDKFYSSMTQWLEEIAEGNSNVSTPEFIRLMYEIAPLPWPRLDYLRRRYAAASEGGKVPPLRSPKSYGDGYDEVACRTKVKWWWNIKTRQTEEPVKSPQRSEARLHSAPRLPQDEKFELKTLSDKSSTTHLQVQGSSCPSEPNSSRYQSADELSPAELDEPSSPSKRPANLQKHEYEVVRSTSTPLAINNEKCAATESSAEQSRTSYQLDDNFLQTINEWQRRNVSALGREQGSYDGEESDDEYGTPGEMSPFKSEVNSSAEASPGDARKVSRTFLDIATQKRLDELMNSEKYSEKSTINHLPPFLQRKFILSRTIHRDRTKPKNTFSPQPDTFINSSPLTITPRSSTRQSTISPLPQLSLSGSAFRTPSPPTVPSSQTQSPMRINPEESDESTVASPPWAAAMAAIGASSSPPVISISKKET
nr:TBC1 domain family 0 [Hymenolepis microstoma]